MTDTVLYFGAGLLAGIVLAFVFAPLLWRQAAHVTRKRVEAERPPVPVDTVTRPSLVAALDEQETGFRDRVRAAEAEVASLRQDLAAERSARELAETQRADASTGRFEAEAALENLRQEMAAKPAPAEAGARKTKADGLRLKLLLNERDELAAEVAELRQRIGSDESDRQDAAFLRERLNDIAAHVMRLAETFEAAGANEPLLGDLARAVAALKDRPRYATAADGEDEEAEPEKPASIADTLAERIKQFQGEVRKAS